MAFPLELSVFISSMTAPFIHYAANNILTLQKPIVILALEGAVLAAVFFMAHLCVRREKSVDPLFYVFSVFSFTSVVDLSCALELDGYVRGFMDFYISKGEPHLNTAHCIMRNYWNGVVHFLLLLTAIHCMQKRKPFRSVALFWVGSMLSSQIVFIPSIIIGKHAKNIYPAFWLNVVFLAMSVWAAVTLFSRTRELPIIPADKVAEEQGKRLLSRPKDLILVFALLAAGAFTVFRGLRHTCTTDPGSEARTPPGGCSQCQVNTLEANMEPGLLTNWKHDSNVTSPEPGHKLVVLECTLDWCFNYIYQYEPYMKDSVAFPKVLMLVFLFYALPLLIMFAYGLNKPGCTWMPDWTLFLAGAVAQMQWTYIGASIHSRTSFTYRMPKEEWNLVMTLNLLYLTVPLLLALHCYRNPAFFMKSVPPGQVNNDKKRN